MHIDPIARPQYAAAAILILAGFACASLPRVATGAENGIGVYPLGSRVPFSGIVPPPGLYLQGDLFYYAGQASPSRALPLNGQVVADVKAHSWIGVPTLMWSTPLQIAGGNLALSASLPIGGPTIGANLVLVPPLFNTPISREASDAVTTIGDPFLTASLGWHAGDLHWNAGLGLNVPVGDYQQGALANVAFHRWAADVYGGFTYLGSKTGVELSSQFGITVNGTNTATDYRTGTELHVDVAALQHLPNGFSFGLFGYFYDQISGDSGSGAKLGAFKGRVAALGGTLGYRFKLREQEISTRVKVFREFAVQNRLEGTAAYFTVAIPLYVMPPPAQVAQR